MSKIETINLHNFNNKEHYQFMADFSELVSTYPTSTMGMEVLYGIFQNSLMVEDLVFRVEDGSAEAKKLEHFDQLRDKTWNAINMRVKATLLSPLQQEVQSAQVIEKIFHQYGDVCSMTYYDESAALTKFTNELLLPENEVPIDGAGLSIWVIELKRLNEQFQAIYNERKSEFAGIKSDNVKAARTLIDPIYYQLVEKINSSIILEFAGPEVITFANKLNEKIKYCHIALIARNRRSIIDENKIEEVKF